MTRFSKTYFTPEKFTAQNAKDFLQNIEEVFSLVSVQKRGVFFDVSRTTKDIDILGQLLIYKFLDFTAKKQCFFNPITNLKENKKVSEEMKRIGFKKLVDENFKTKDPIDNQPTYSQTTDFFIAPIVLERTQNSSITNNTELKIIDYYKNPIISTGILHCIGEISSNFQEHAVSDTKSVLVARGNKKQIEIACADNGDGIISTLMPILNGNYRNHKYDVIGKSIEINVTSKAKDGHMGCGLWLVNQYVTATNGILCIYSQDGYLINRGGKIKCGKSPFWKGTIIYLKMPVTNVDAFSKVMKQTDEQISMFLESIGKKINLNII